MRISDWSSDVCSSDLASCQAPPFAQPPPSARKCRFRLPHRSPTWSVEKRPASDSTTFALRWPELRLTTLRGQISCKSFCFAVPDRPDSPGTETIAEIVQIGRASCRERVCQYGSISVVAGYLKTKKQKTNSYVY